MKAARVTSSTHLLTASKDGNVVAIDAVPHVYSTCVFLKIWLHHPGLLGVPWWGRKRGWRMGKNG